MSASEPTYRVRAHMPLPDGFVLIEDTDPTTDGVRHASTVASSRAYAPSMFGTRISARMRYAAGPIDPPDAYDRESEALDAAEQAAEMGLAVDAYLAWERCDPTPPPATPALAPDVDIDTTRPAATHARQPPR